MNLPKKVKLVEVGPRDGLQNEPQNISADFKVEFINRLSKTGLKVIEVGSLVSPTWVPQMAETDEVFKNIHQVPGISYPVLVPNIEGLKRALDINVKEIAIFAAASQSFSKKNLNASIEESLEKYTRVAKEALEKGLKVRGYVSCVLGCPYEGEIDSHAVGDVVIALKEMGCYEVSLGDTIGVGTPLKVQKLLEHVFKNVPKEQIAVHFHDTYGQALSNILAALQMGVEVVDAAVSGLGGCPYAKGASGNVSSEDVLYMLEGLGIETGVDLNKLVAVGQFVSEKLDRFNMSRVGQALKEVNN